MYGDLHAKLLKENYYIIDDDNSYFANICLASYIRAR